MSRAFQPVWWPAGRLEYAVFSRDALASWRAAADGHWGKFAGCVSATRAAMVHPTVAEVPPVVGRLPVRGAVAGGCATFRGLPGVGSHVGWHSHPCRRPD